VTAAPPVRKTLTERLAVAYVLLLVYVLLLMLYAWQTTKHQSPWLFTDELEWAEESRGIAHHGVAQLRGQDVGFKTLFPYLLAPAWWAHGTSAGYSAAKYINAAVAAAAVFPGYALARLFLGRPSAVACGIATAVIPAAAYAGLLIPEPFAYFFSTLTLWLVARALLRPTVASVVAAIAALVLAPYVRSELFVMKLTAAIALFVVVATSAFGRRLVSSWRRIEQVGAVVLAVAALMWVGAVVTHHSETWATGTYYHHRLFEYGLWAIGAFTIGLGVLPVVVTLAWLLGNRFAALEERVAGGVLIGTVVAFWIYTAVKASKLSTVFAIRVEERNFIYVAPVVFLAVALWARTGRTRLLPVLLSAGAVAYLLDITPYHNTEDFYSDAPGLSVLQWLNRQFYFTTTDARRLLYGILIGSVAMLVATDVLVRRRRFPRIVVPATAVLAVLVIGWCLWGEAAAADASNRFSKGFRAVLPTPPDWIDRTTGGHRTMFIGQSLQGSNAFWSLEFWNQSMQDVWSVDATAPGPGPTVTPDFSDTSGTLRPQPPLDWVVATPGIDPVGTLVAPVGGLRLFHVPHPIRLAATTSGLSPDASWMSTAATYVRFGAPSGAAGVASVTLSRTAACGTYVSSPVTIRVTRLRINAQSQPSAGGLLAQRRVIVRSNPCGGKVYSFHVRPPFRIDLTASGTFLSPDGRQLAAQVAFGYRAR
jgi:hypothetical protein